MEEVLIHVIRMARMGSLRKMAHSEDFEVPLCCGIVYLGKSLHEVYWKTITFFCTGTNAGKCAHM